MIQNLSFCCKIPATISEIFIEALPLWLKKQHLLKMVTIYSILQILPLFLYDSIIKSNQNRGKKGCLLLNYTFVYI